MDTDYLDRNIRLLMGHAPVRSWHDTDGIPSLGLDGPSLKEKRFLVLEDRLANQTIIKKQLQKLGVDEIEAFQALDHELSDDLI